MNGWAGDGGRERQTEDDGKMKRKREGEGLETREVRREMMGEEEDERRSDEREERGKRRSEKGKETAWRTVFEYERLKHRDPFIMPMVCYDANDMVMG